MKSLWVDTVLRRRAINLGVSPTAILSQLESIGEEFAMTIKEQSQKSKKRKQDQIILDKMHASSNNNSKLRQNKSKDE